MPSSQAEQEILAALQQMDIVDCHEHIGSEADRLAIPVDVFSLFSCYTHFDLLNAGMFKADYQRLFQRELPLATRWKLFAPYWERIRWTSFSRPVHLAVKRFYNADDLNEHNYAEISAQISDANIPGVYQRVLGDACGIRTVLANRWPLARQPCGLLLPVPPLLNGWYVPICRRIAARPSGRLRRSSRVGEREYPRRLTWI